MEPFVHTLFLTLTPFAGAFGFYFPFTSASQLVWNWLWLTMQGCDHGLSLSILMKRWLTCSLLTLVSVIGLDYYFPCFGHTFELSP